MTDLLYHACAYCVRGLGILPISDGKVVALRTWKQWQTTRPTEAQLRRWFARSGITGLAVVCGPVSGGLCVRDFDTLDAYRRWADAHPDLAATLPTVQTAQGRHVYFRGPALFHDFGNGEYRGDAGHYVLLPPSKHPSGATYRWIIPLPDGPLPMVDPVAAGLLPADAIEPLDRAQSAKNAGCYTRAQNDDGRTPKITECRVAVCGGQPQKSISLGSLDTDTLSRIDRAIRAVQPQAQGQRQRFVFKLARTLRGIDALADADPRSSPLVERWHKLALPFIVTKAFTETWIDFLRGWSKVKYPRGLLMKTILERAKATPPAEAEHYDITEVRLLAAVCSEFQKDAGDAPFFLSARTAGEMLGVSAMAAWRYLYLLESDGLLAVVERGAKRKATRYRYVGGQPQTTRDGAKIDALMGRMTAKLNRKAKPSPTIEQRKAELRRQAKALKAAEHLRQG